MSDVRQRAIIKVFRKFSNSLGPDVLVFLEQILDEHGIADQDVESSIETLAKEYNKQDGKNFYLFAFLSLAPTSLEMQR
ncbi:hypothetical protein GYMLUDRAFT_805773 [Collybiopsis luxurians FD-317 M1]|nr:hypothetical protein GYMLUDRAFT_805773 [Collybiopsis luxurians FD-317 M1]